MPHEVRNFVTSLKTKVRSATFVLTLLASDAAKAGPPYITDDPEPTRNGGWENYLFVSGITTPSEATGQAGLELNYGAAENLQLSLTLPVDYASTRGLRAATGDVDAGVKYRFLHPPDGSWLPDAAIFPALTIPTGSQIFSTGHASFFMPLWLGKDFGKWSTFGGGGYVINPGGGQRNFALAGWALTRSLGSRLNIGVELYHQTAATAGASGSTNIGVGAVYQMTKQWAVMASGGPGLERPSHPASSAFYISLQFTN